MGGWWEDFHPSALKNGSHFRVSWVKYTPLSSHPPTPNSHIPFGLVRA